MKIQTGYGYYQYREFNGHIFIDQFTVNKEFRGKGYGYKLGKLLPAKCWLQAWPNSGNKMDDSQLRAFYRKLGFRFYWCANRATYYGFKGFAPTKKFWNQLLSPVP